MSGMDHLRTCPCVSGGEVEDILNCAPCPPPFMTYMELKLTAVGKLCKKEVCSIARRCNMSESQELSKDCPLHKTSTASFKCDLFCIIITVSVLAVVLMIILIVAVSKRRRDATRQDTINVVFNETDSETSRKSSDQGSVNIVHVQADCHDDNVTRKEDRQDGQEAQSQPTNVIGEGFTPVNRSEAVGFSKEVQVDCINGQSQVTLSGLRSRANVAWSDTGVVAKL